jgi:Leucine-rich repeat (LRR) protein
MHMTKGDHRAFDEEIRDAIKQSVDEGALSLRCRGFEGDELPQAVVDHFTRQTNIVLALDLYGNRLYSLPSPIAILGRLEDLTLDGNQLHSLPDWISRLSSLQSLSVAANRLTGLPYEIGDIGCLKVLNLSHNLLEDVPRPIRRLADSLEELHLDGNKELAFLPSWLAELHTLRFLGASNTALDEVPAWLDELRLAVAEPTGEMPLPARPGDSPNLQQEDEEDQQKQPDTSVLANEEDPATASALAAPLAEQQQEEVGQATEDAANEGAMIEEGRIEAAIMIQRCARGWKTRHGWFFGPPPPPADDLHDLPPSPPESEAAGEPNPEQPPNDWEEGGAERVAQRMDPMDSVKSMEEPPSFEVESHEEDAAITMQRHARGMIVRDEAPPPDEPLPPVESEQNGAPPPPPETVSQLSSLDLRNTKIVHLPEKVSSLAWRGWSCEGRLVSPSSRPWRVDKAEVDTFMEDVQSAVTFGRRPFKTPKEHRDAVPRSSRFGRRRSIFQSFFDADEDKASAAEGLGAARNETVAPAASRELRPSGRTWQADPETEGFMRAMQAMGGESGRVIYK